MKWFKSINPVIDKNIMPENQVLKLVGMKKYESILKF